MHFSFIEELFPMYDTEIRIENDIETIYIYNKQFEDAIIIHYYPDNYYNYLLRFSTQHRDTSSKEDLIEFSLAYANAQKAAIEFYEDGSNRFGGEIEVSLLDNLTYDELRKHFGYPHSDLSNLTFTVRAWNERYCFDAYFAKNESGKISIVKNYIKKHK